MPFGRERTSLQGIAAGCRVLLSPVVGKAGGLPLLEQVLEQLPCLQRIPIPELC